MGCVYNVGYCFEILEYGNRINVHSIYAPVVNIVISFTYGLSSSRNRDLLCAQNSYWKWTLMLVWAYWLNTKRLIYMVYIFQHNTFSNIHNLTPEIYSNTCPTKPWNTKSWNFWHPRCVRYRFYRCLGIYHEVIYGYWTFNRLDIYWSVDFCRSISKCS